MHNVKDKVMATAEHMKNGVTEIGRVAARAFRRSDDAPSEAASTQGELAADAADAAEKVEQTTNHLVDKARAAVHPVEQKVEVAAAKTKKQSTGN